MNLRITSRTALVWAGLALAFVVIVAAGVAIAVLPQESRGPERGVTLEQVVQHPESLIGSRVTISGLVAAAQTRPRAFAVGDDLADTVLVLPAEDAELTAWPRPDDVARVTGRIAIYERSYLRERDDLVGWAGSPFLDDFEGEPMILAERIEILG